MATYDKVSGSYQLSTNNGEITFTSNGGTGNVTINGNLYIIGSISNVESTNTFFYDNFITLNANVNTAPILNAGIEVRRGPDPTVSLRWNESLDRWQITSDGSYFANIMIRLEDDFDAHLGSNLYTTGSYFSNTNWEIRSTYPHNIVLAPGWDGNVANAGLQIRHVSANNFSTVSNASVLFARTAEAGETGLFVANPSREDELITKRKALIYSLVL
jgi:hypothetical protein